MEDFSEAMDDFSYGNALESMSGAGQNPQRLVPPIGSDDPATLPSLAQMLKSPLGRFFLEERGAKPEGAPSESSAKEALLKLNGEDAAVREYLGYCAFAKKPIDADELSNFRILGRGAFGAVSGCAVEEIGKLLARKVMNRKQVESQRMQWAIKNELDALKRCAVSNHPHCMHLIYAFEFDNDYNFMMPLASGGDLSFHLKRDKGFEPPRVLAYAAEVASGLGHMHSLGLLYRDLKPANILINSAGHCVISDLGLVKCFHEGTPIAEMRTKGHAGTSGYWAPEVLAGVEYGVGSDWWAFGVFVCELFTGEVIFGKKITGLKTRDEATKSWAIVLPPGITKEGGAFIMALLVRDETKRLGGKANNGCIGFDAVKKHDYWKGVDWDVVLAGEHPTTFVPVEGQIYTESASEIDDHDQTGQFASVKLSDELHVDLGAFVEINTHEEHLVEVLKMDRAGKLDKLKENKQGETMSSGCVLL